MHTTFKFLEPYSQREEQRFYMAGVGLREWMSPEIVDRPNGTWDWLLMFFHEPTVIKVGSHISEYPPNTLAIWDDSQGHYYGNLDSDWSHSWVHFQGSVARSLVEQAGLSPGVFPDLDIDDVLEHYLAAIHRERLRPDISLPILENLFQCFLYEVGRVHTPAKPALTSPIQTVQRYIELNYPSSVSLDDLCQLAAISKPHLISEFRRQVGIPPIDFLIQTRLKHACSLLLNRNLSITEVAERVGYNDIYHFSKLFKKHMGGSPSSFRGKTEPKSLFLVGGLP